MALSLKYKIHALKRFRHILNAIVWTIVGSYMLLSALLHIPAIQEYTGKCVAKALEDKFGTEVNVGKINLGFLNRIIIDDFNMLDKKNHEMFHAARLSVSINVFSLINGEISISSAQVLGLKANLYQESANSQPNYQFVVDSLKSKDNSKSQLNLHIGSFIIRNGSVKYNKYFVSATPRKFNVSHINLTNISSDIRIKQITNDNLKLEAKKISFKEHSGLTLKNLSFTLAADKTHATLKGFKLEMPSSSISTDSITANYTIRRNGEIDMNQLSSAGNINSEGIIPSDLSFILPELKNYSIPLKLNVSYKLNNGKLNVSNISLFSIDNSIRLTANGYVSTFNKTHDWNINIKNFHVGESFLNNLFKTAAALKLSLPNPILNIKKLDVYGKAWGKANKLYAKAAIRTNFGEIRTDIHKDYNNLLANLDTEGLNIGEFLSNKNLGKLSLKVKAKGTIHDNRITSVHAVGKIPSVDYKKYSYKNTNFDVAYNGNSAKGKISISDPNIDAELTGALKNITGNLTTDITAIVDRLYPQRLNITDKWGNAKFSTQCHIHTTGKDLKNIIAELSMKNFSFKSTKEEYSITSLDAAVCPNRINIISDFGSIELNGKYNISTIGESICGILKKKLPTLPGLNKKIYASDNNFNISANITDTKWLEILAGIPFHAEKPINIDARINDNTRAIDAKINIPEFSYAEQRFKNGNIILNTVCDTLFADIRLKKMMENNSDINLSLKANAADNKLKSKLHFDYNTPTKIKGVLNMNTRFYKENNSNNILFEFEPSELMVKDTAWHIRPSSIIYNSRKIQFNHFAIEHGMQHIKIDGLATDSPSDSICVNLKDVDVSYILNLVNFHSVEFNGRASGQAYLKSVLESPDAYANLTVNDFKFQEGRMGVLHANVNWNKAEKQIDINASADDDNNVKTIIKGYVSPARNYIDLGITAQNTNIEFLKSFCSSFMEDIKANANGFAQVYGDLSEINLRGQLVANGSLKISTLNTKYFLKNDTIRMEPNEIIFSGDTVRDRNNNIAIVNGALHHKNLTRLTYDIDIKANNFLCYDFASYGDNTFYGTVYGTGDCNITGRPHSIVFNIDMTPQRGSFIEYNAANPDAITNQDFITWTSSENKNASEPTTIKDLNEASDMHLNFNVNTTPDFTLRILMDKSSGDKISLNGNGAIKANYFNKGSFDMYGTYLIDHGTYDLTIQNIIRKNFQFQQGSNIIFGGNPFNARLNMKAAYQVNGVPLADLKIGNSFSSNNVRVDCIMNIGGTPENIKVDFDLDMPTVNNDAKQMVRSLINSEEEMNQQVVYLLAIGRFYMDNKNNSTQEAAQQSQTSLAMQSLLSGTISQQVNDILGSIIKNNSWNFGTNISTGTDGFNNAEYEGILSGSLLNNRLLINGQFGYRDNPNTTSSFIGDFDLKYLLTPSGSIAIKVYNQTNDRYFTKSSINTQGIGLILKRDFGNWREMFGWKKKKK